MKKIAYECAVALVENAHAVVIDESDVVVPGIGKNETKPHIHLWWQNEDGEHNIGIFHEENVDGVMVKDNSLVFVDADGNEISLSLLQKQNLDTL